MARINKKVAPIHTHEGGRAKHINPEQQLRRSVMACMLWEKSFYEDGQDIASRISGLVPVVKPEAVAALAIEAREKMKLRHAPLLLVREMARHQNHKRLVGETLAHVIQRADEITEFIAMYWQDGKTPLSAQVKKGLASAFLKFNAYQLAKYNRESAIKLRDALFLCHAKPTDTGQEDLWRKLISGDLPVADTWETALSSGGDKKMAWERLLSENKIGALALLRNLRNMHDAGVDRSVIVSALDRMKADRVLPFRFISAAKYAPGLEPELEKAMMKCLAGQGILPGHTVLLVDVSGSMDGARISAKSEIDRLDAACGLAMLLREICDRIDIFTFSMKLATIPARHGFALKDAIKNSQEHSGTPLGHAIKAIYAERGSAFDSADFGPHGIHNVDYKGQGLRPDRLIVITDEQASGSVPHPIGRGYMINVSTDKNGVGYGPWIHIDGWSEAVVDYIQEVERDAETIEKNTAEMQ